MAYEYPSVRGKLRLLRIKRRWTVEFNGSRNGRWPSPDAAARAAAEHQSGVPDWDHARAPISGDLLDWRPLGDSL